MEKNVDVIIVAAGNSTRFGENKILFPIGSQTVVARTVETFAASPRIAHIILVVKEADAEEIEVGLGKEQAEKVIFVRGGQTRYRSVENGLVAVSSPYVLIHDGARPFVSNALIEKVIETTIQKGSAVPVLPVTDSVRYVANGMILGSMDREDLRMVQTPQGYKTDDLRLAYSASQEEYADESSLFARYVSPPFIINGENGNLKITSLGSCYGINAKVGIGYDLHKLVPERKLILGGVEIDSELGSLAHSDGDAVIHALIDALLSAVGELDLGSHFPDNNPKYDGIDSTLMLSEVMNIIRNKNAKVLNAAITVIIDKPKLFDYIPLMRIKLARLMGIPQTCVTIAAKTTEGTSPFTVQTYATVAIN